MPALGSKKGRKLDLPTTALRSKGGLPLYVQLLTLFRRRIESGEWPIGQRIPTLHQLIDELNVARVTIRHALGLLEEEGIIGRYQGRGTYVLRRPDSTIWYRIPMTWDELIGAAPDIEFEWLFDGPAEHAPLPFHEEGTAAPTYHFMRRLLLRHHIPYCIGETYIEQSIFDAVGRHAFDAPVPLQVLNAHLKGRIGAAKQTVRAGTADIEMAALLHLAAHAPVMIVTRSILSRGGTLVYESIGTFRGDFVEIQTDLTPPK